MKNLYEKYYHGTTIKSNCRVDHPNVISNKKSKMSRLGKALVLLAAIHAAVSATLPVTATSTPNNVASTNVTLPPIGGRYTTTLEGAHQRTSNLIGARISRSNSTAPSSANNSSSNLLRELSPVLIKGVKQSNSTSEGLAKHQLITKQNKSSLLGGFGGQASPSLFKPSFLKGLLGRDKVVSADESADQQDQAQESEQEQDDRQKSSSGKGDDEEEVTKTIEVPMKDEDDEEASGGDKQNADSGASGGSEDGDDSMVITRNALSPKKRHKSGEIRPKTAASLQLTSTEMNSILNDQEGPEYYRMRELIGDGVLVNEERRLATAASTGFGPGGFMNGAGSGEAGAFDGSDAAALAIGHRLLHSASEDGSGMGLMHRFGAFGGSSPNSELGRLAQSPNEYSEIHSNVGDGSGGGGFAPMAAYAGGAGDGLIRAGSGDGLGYGANYGAGLGSFGANAGGFNGYPNSPMLDGHSSELYGGAYGGSPGAGFGANSQAYLYNRLAAAASQGPAGLRGGFGFSIGAAGGGDDEYTSRYGHPFDQRGFASQNRAMLRDHSMISQSDFPGESMKSAAPSVAGTPLVGNSQLVPLSPIVPMADEVGGGQASQLRETNYGTIRQQRTMDRQEGRATSAAAAQEDGGASPRNTAEHEDDANNYDGSAQVIYNEPNPTMLPREASNRHGHGRYTSRLMANNDQTSQTYPGDDLNQQQQSSAGPIIEFARVGGAGYLAPRLLSEQSLESHSENLLPLRSTQQFSKKTGGLEQFGQQHTRLSDNYDPAENPAHAGKFIIE